MMVVFGGVEAMGQGDTLEGRSDRYYYYKWYDTCNRFYDCPSELTDRNWFFLCSFSRRDTSIMVGRQFFVPGKMSIEGLVVMGEGYFGNPEYLRIYQVDSTQEVQSTLLKSVRWDVEPPFVMKLPQCQLTMGLGDPTKFMYPTAREVHFDRPVVVDTNFIVAGTNKSGAFGQVFYTSISMRDYDHCEECYGQRKLTYNGEDKTWHEEGECGHAFGPFLLILDTASYQLMVKADSAEWGTVTGSGSYVSMTQVEIAAEPNAGYRFAGWADGPMENPRMVDVVSDTLFVARFAPLQGIEETEGQVSDFGVSPNPATGYVDVTVAESGEYRLELYDNSGRRLMVLRFTGQRTRVEVATLSAGSYYLVLCGNGKEEKRSFIKL